MTTAARDAGFRMPAEWAPHAGCWMAWPCRPENWDDIERARATYVEVARAIARFEPVTMTANAEDAGAARRALAGVADVDVVVVAQRRLVGARHGADVRHRRPRRARRRGLALQRLRRHLRGVRAHAQHGAAHPRPARGETLRRAPRPRGRRRPRRRRGDRAHDRRGRAGPAPQPGPGARRGRAAPVRLPGRREGALAQLGARPRQHRRPRGQPRLLRRARRRRGARLRRPRRPAARRRAREPRAPARGAPTPAAAPSRWWSCRCRRGPSSGDAGSRPATSTSTSPTAASSCRPSATRPTTRRATSSPASFPRRTVVQVPTLELAKADGNIHCVTQQQPVA